MTSPEIPEEAVTAAAKAFHEHDKHDPWDDEGCNDSGGGEYPSCKEWTLEGARAMLAAALPHLRVQETRGIELPADGMMRTVCLDGDPLPDAAALRDRIAEALADRWTQPLDIANRREDWTYPERPMSERIKDQVDASYRTGPDHDTSLVLRAPTCLEIADAVIATLPAQHPRPVVGETGRASCGSPTSHDPHDWFDAQGPVEVHCNGLVEPTGDRPAHVESRNLTEVLHDERAEKTRLAVDCWACEAAVSPAILALLAGRSAPRPVVDREAAIEALRTELERQGADEFYRVGAFAADLADAVLALLPTEEASVYVVHHHDIEKHAESFNEGYEEAQRQRIGGEESRNWLTEKVWPLLKDHIDPENSHHVADQIADALLSEADLSDLPTEEGEGS